MSGTDTVVRRWVSLYPSKNCQENVHSSLIATLHSPKEPVVVFRFPIIRKRTVSAQHSSNML